MAFEKHGILPSQVIFSEKLSKLSVLIRNFTQESEKLLPRQCVAECDAEEVDKIQIVGFLSQQEELKPQKLATNKPKALK